MVGIPNVVNNGGACTKRQATTQRSRLPAKTMSMSRSIFYLLVIFVAAVPAAYSNRIGYGEDNNTPQPNTPQPSPAPTTPAPNSFSPHDRICREYLKTFLQGTTDSKDECQGLQNAYSAADCSASDTDDDEANNPWKRWWHDLIGDDDWTGGDSTDDNGGGDGDGRSLLYSYLEGDGDDQVSMIDDTYENRACCSTIRSYYAVRCPSEGKMIDPTILLIIASILIACGIVKAILRSVENPFVKSFPEAAGCILVGAAAGIAVRLLVPGVDLDRVAFDEDLFLSIFLPPIIFQAALAIDKSALGKNIIPVATFAIGGTFLSAILTSAIVFIATKPMANPIPGLDASIFGALISSIDPVATLSVLSAVGISESDTIYILVFGESLLNDGVAIVLFRVLLDHLQGWEEDETLAAFVVTVAERFFIVSLGSILIGLTSGVACTFYFWALQGRHIPVLEVGMFFIWSLVPYYIGDAVGYSSVISMMATLFFVDLFVIGRHSDVPSTAYANIGECEVGESSVPFQEANRQRMFSTAGQLSSVSRHHIGFVAEVVSSLMETIIFAYLGLFLFTEKHLNFSLSIIAIVACVGSRAVMVVSLSWILNTSRTVLKKCRQLCCNGGSSADDDGSIRGADPPSQEQQAGKFLGRDMQKILFLSGIRGAVSLALVENIPLYNAVSHDGSKFKAELKTMTISSIIFTVFAFGSATYRFMKSDSRTSEAEVNAARMHEPLLLTEELPQHANLSRGDGDDQRVEIDHGL